MSCGPIPPQSATANGIGTNASSENVDAEKQMAAPKGMQGNSPPPTTSGSGENGAAEQQPKAP